MVSQTEMILRVITFWFLVLSQFFRDCMGLLKARHYPLFNCEVCPFSQYLAFLYFILILWSYLIGLCDCLTNIKPDDLDSVTTRKNRLSSYRFTHIILLMQETTELSVNS